MNVSIWVENSNCNSRPPTLHMSRPPRRLRKGINSGFTFFVTYFDDSNIRTVSTFKPVSSIVELVPSVNTFLG